MPCWVCGAKSTCHIFLSSFFSLACNKSSVGSSSIVPVQLTNLEKHHYTMLKYMSCAFSPPFPTLPSFTPCLLLLSLTAPMVDIDFHQVYPNYLQYHKFYLLHNHLVHLCVIFIIKKGPELTFE